MSLHFYTGDTAEITFTPKDNIKLTKQARRDVYSHDESKKAKEKKVTKDSEYDEQIAADETVTIETLYPMQENGKILKMFWYQLKDTNVIKHFNKEGFCERLLWVIREGQVVELFDLIDERVVYSFKKGQTNDNDESTIETTDKVNLDTNGEDSEGTQTAILNKKHKNGQKLAEVVKAFLKPEKIKTCKELNDERNFKDINFIGFIQIDNKLYLCNNCGQLTQLTFKQPEIQENFEFKDFEPVATETNFNLYKEPVYSLRTMVQNPYKPHEFAVGGLNLNVRFYDVNDIPRVVFAVKNPPNDTLDLTRKIDVTSIQFLPFKNNTTNNRFIVTHSDGSVRYYSHPKKKPERLEEFKKPIIASLLSPEEQSFFLGFADGTLKRNPTNSEYHSYKGDFAGLTGAVTDIKSTKYNRENVLVSTSLDRFLRIHYNAEMNRTLIKRIWLKVAPTCVLPLSSADAESLEKETTLDSEGDDPLEQDWKVLANAKRIKF